MKKKLLIVVDYQNDFVSGSLGCPQAVAIEESADLALHPEYRRLAAVR